MTLFDVYFRSNHDHQLLSSKDAPTIASFMQYVGSNIAGVVVFWYQIHGALRKRIEAELLSKRSQG